MAFVVGSVIIGAGAALGGAALSSKGAKDAAKTAAAGSDREIDFLRESRDIARRDTGPYREMGYRALNRLGEMTGLGEVGIPGDSPPSIGQDGAWAASPWSLERRDQGFFATGPDEQEMFWDGGGWQSTRTSAFAPAGRMPSTPPQWNRGRGDPEMFGRAHGGALFMVNELGPESVYDKGGYSRSSKPTVLPPSPTGYVKPTGRAIGGQMGNTHVLPGYGERPGYGGHGDVQPASGGFNQGGPPQQPPIEGEVVPAGSGPAENTFDLTTDPGYQFRLGEGMRALERSAAAKGGLLSGGFARKALRYGQNYASDEFSKIYNRIATIAGYGGSAAGQSGNQAITTGQGMGRAASDRAITSAYGDMAGTNAWANAANEIGQLPWGSVFNRGSTKRGGPVN